jgi:hypothetical protein
MPYDFPNTPAVNDTTSLPSGVVFKWDGTKWVGVGSTVAVSAYQTPWVTNIDGASHSLINVTQEGIGNNGTLPVDPTAYPGYNWLIDGPQAASSQCGVVTLCSNTTTTSGVNVGIIMFANYAVSGLDKRIASIRSATDGAVNSGRLSFFTWNAGVSAEVMSVTSAGLVGIGITAPLYTLDVQAAQASVRVYSKTAGNPVYESFSAGGTSALIIGVEGSVAGNMFTGSLAYASFVNANSACSLQFAANNTVAMTISTTGLVGIGTTSPTQMLQVSNTTSSAGCVIEIDSGASYGSGVRSKRGTQSWFMGAGPAAIPYALYDETRGAAVISFLTNGNVGIGGTGSGINPAYPLDIVGDCNITGTYRVNGVALATGGTPGGSDKQVQWNYQGNTFGANGNLVFDYNNNYFGIGTANPRANLDVSTDVITQVYRGIVSAQYYTGAHSACLWFIKGRGTRAAPATVASGDFGMTILAGCVTTDGSIQFTASISTVVTAVGAASVTQDMTFATGTGSTGTERLRITSGGNIQIAGTGNLIWGAYGGGFYMQDTSWIRAVGGAGLWMSGGTLGTDGKLVVDTGSAAGPGPVTVKATSPGYGVRVISSSGNGYAADWYNDGGNFYCLLTNSGDPYGGYNGLRPFYINLSNGGVTMGNGLQATNVGIGGAPNSYALYVATDAAAKPNSVYWTQYSDPRTKRNVRRFEGDMDLIRKLDPIVAEYNGRGGTPAGTRVVGFDAAKLREILPQAVFSHRGKLDPTDKEETDILGFNPHEIFFHMLLAIQQMDRELTELKKRNN